MNFWQWKKLCSVPNQSVPLSGNSAFEVQWGAQTSIVMKMSVHVVHVLFEVIMLLWHCWLVDELLTCSHVVCVFSFRICPMRSRWWSSMRGRCSPWQRRWETNLSTCEHTLFTCWLQFVYLPVRMPSAWSCGTGLYNLSIACGLDLFVQSILRQLCCDLGLHK